MHKNIKCVKFKRVVGLGGCMGKTITITFDEDGNAVVKVEGCEGDECIRLLDALLRPFEPRILESKRCSVDKNQGDIW
jgi:hypothetical protein